MRVQIKKWGNSASVRIPAALMAATSLRFDQTVELIAEEGRIIIRPLASPSYDLDQMLDSMDPDTFPEDVDLGPPRGREAW